MNDNRSLRQRINASFSDTDLYNIAFDEFRVVYDRYTAGMDKDKLIQILLEYCARTRRGKLLLQVIEKERPGLIGPDHDELLTKLESPSDDSQVDNLTKLLTVQRNKLDKLLTEAEEQSVPLSVIDQIRTERAAIRQTKAVLRDFGIECEDREVEKEDPLVLRLEGLLRRLAKARTQSEREDILTNIERLVSVLRGQDIVLHPYHGTPSVEGSNAPTTTDKDQWIDDSARNAAIGYLLGKAVEMAGQSSSKLSDWVKNGFK